MLISACSGQKDYVAHCEDNNKDSLGEAIFNKTKNGDFTVHKKSRTGIPRAKKKRSNDSGYKQECNNDSDLIVAANLCNRDDTEDSCNEKISIQFKGR